MLFSAKTTRRAFYLARLQRIFKPHALRQAQLPADIAADYADISVAEILANETMLALSAESPAPLASSPPVALIKVASPVTAACLKQQPVADLNFAMTTPFAVPVQPREAENKNIGKEPPQLQIRCIPSQTMIS